jgi:hypothetical protein
MSKYEQDLKEEEQQDLKEEEQQDYITLLNILQQSPYIERQIVLNNAVREYDNIFYDNIFYDILSENKEIIEYTLKNIVMPNINIDHTLINLTLSLWSSSINGTIPDLNKITEHAINIGCGCIRQSPRNIQIIIMQHFIVNLGYIPNCRSITACLEYYTYNNILPTSQILTYTLNVMNDMMNSPEDFYQKDKVRIPTVNIKFMKSNLLKENDQEIFCALCQECLKINQQCYTLNPCGHMFHASSKQCLDTDSILTWLSQDNKCPICKTVVIVKETPDDINEGE